MEKPSQLRIKFIFAHKLTAKKNVPTNIFCSKVVMVFIMPTIKVTD